MASADEAAKRHELIKAREDVWLIARNCLRQTYPDPSEYKPSDIFNLACFLSADAFDTRVSLEQPDDDDDDDDDREETDEEQA